MAPPRAPQLVAGARCAGRLRAGGAADVSDPHRRDAVSERQVGCSFVREAFWLGFCLGPLWKTRVVFNMKRRCPTLPVTAGDVSYFDVPQNKHRKM